MLLVGLARVLPVGLLVLLVLLVLSAVGSLVVRGHNSLATGQVDVDTASVILGRILQTEFLANLLDARLDLLDMANRVVALSDNPTTRLETWKSQASMVTRAREHTHANGSARVPWHI